MERVLRIKSSDFINWFFNSGSDQEQIEQVLTLGRYIADLLLEGSVTIRPQDILDGCEQSVTHPIVTGKPIDKVTTFNF